MNCKSIMVQGTASGAGKSLLVTALCRIFKNDGYKVAPFKSQNMSLNSFVTIDGGEMGRAQVVQAEAAGVIPSVIMNPVLIKPTSDMGSQIIVCGKPLNNMSVMDYYGYKKKLKRIIKRCYSKLSDEYQIVVIEGAGSPAEINLKKNDIVNMGMAKMADAPVIIVGDIDKGGVFASLVGTMKLLTPSERERVCGVVINKFRGDKKLLEPGLKMLENIIKKPVIGVIPHLDIDIEDEDSVTDRLNQSFDSNKNIDIGVIKLPYMSNFTDFNCLKSYEDVNIRYITKQSNYGDPDCIIIPGTKNTIHDLIYLKMSGFAELINKSVEQGNFVIGICGGYQMLGIGVKDPYNLEGGINYEKGLSLIPMKTVIRKNKITKQVTGIVKGLTGEFESLNGQKIKGYEIHMGRSTFAGENTGFVEINGEMAGSFNSHIIGSYIHGIFDNSNFTNTVLNSIRKQKGLNIVEKDIDYHTYKEKEYDKLAEMVKKSLDMEKVYKILNRRLT